MNQRGFTLVEILIVLAIIAAAMTMGVPRLFKKETKMGPIAHHLSILSREIRNRARMNHSTYRLVLILEKGKSQYYVERASRKVLIDAESIKAEMEKKPDSEKTDEPAPPPLFQMETGILKKPKELPKTISLTSLETANTGGAITQGKGFIHYSAEGLVESAVLQITNPNNQTWSLVFNPLTGQVTIIEEAKNLSEVIQ